MMAQIITLKTRIIIIEQSNMQLVNKQFGQIEFNNVKDVQEDDTRVRAFGISEVK